jgi:uncharacterized ferritin-like protein (DUF455 family)
MGSYTAPETKLVRGVAFRRDPAREECFRVVHLHKEMENLSDMSDTSRRQRIHQHMHNEMQSLEIAAQCIVDFPDTEWELQMELARQCWDETRHTQMLYDRLRALGGYKGEFAVMNYEWGITCMMDSLAARLALQNRTFEGGEMDLLRELVDNWRQAGDDDTAELLAGILADEIQHVRFANQWLKRLEVNAAGVPLTGYTRVDVFANVEDRRHAEFTEAEIAEILRQEGFSGLVAEAARA